MLGEKLKELRRLNKVTQKQLADFLFIDQTAVSYWEQGKTNPDINNLVQIAKYFNVSTDYLIYSEEKPRKIFVYDETIELYYKLDDIDKAQLKAAINHLLSADKYTHNNTGKKKNFATETKTCEKCGATSQNL